MQEIVLDLKQNAFGKTDSITGKGIVTIKLFNKNNELVETIKDHNLIVKTGRSELIKKIAGTSTLNKIGKCAVGSGGALPGSLQTPIAPTPGDTALYSRTLIKDIGSTVVDTSQTSPKVTYTTLFTCSEINGNVNECGLFFTDGTTMFSRYTFKTVPLDLGSGFSMEIEWVIQF